MYICCLEIRKIIIILEFYCIYMKFGFVLEIVIDIILYVFVNVK